MEQEPEFDCTKITDLEALTLEGKLEICKWGFKYVKVISSFIVSRFLLQDRPLDRKCQGQQ